MKNGIITLRQKQNLALLSKKVADDFYEYYNENTVDTEKWNHQCLKQILYLKWNQLLKISTISYKSIAVKLIEKDIEMESVEYTKLSIEERVELLPEQTGDIMTEFDAYL